MSWDAIVVGGGLAGCIAASRLSASGRKVALVEAGPGEPRPASVSGLDTVAAAEEHSRQWAGLEVSASPTAAGQRYRQGFGLGGGSMINSLVLSPGDESDYRRWETAHGCLGWGPDAMAPWLHRATTAFLAKPIERGPFSSGFAVAAAAAGHAVGGSSLDQGRLGLLETRLAASETRRWSAVEAYVSAQGPTVMTETAVTRILIDDDRAVGILLADGTELHSPLVVLAAGALRSPELLLRSGLVKRPVGARLKDHPSFVFTVALADSWIGATQPGRSAAAAGDPSIGVTARTISTMLRWSSGPDRHGDLQAFVIDRVDDGAATDRPSPPDQPKQDQALAVIAVGLMDVSSVGSVTLDQNEQNDGGDGVLRVTTGYLQSADDRRRLRDGVVQVAALLQSPEMGPMIDAVFIDDLGTPVEQLMSLSDAAIDRWIAAHPGPYAHPAGSCPMGPASDPAAVVSSEPGSLGQLHGYHGVHVVDASVLPDLVHGGLQLPVAAVAERISAELAHQG